MCLLLTINLSRSITDLRRRGSIVEETREALAKTELQHEKLNQKYTEVQSPFFVEQQARDKLNMAKKGEIVAILPPVTPILSPTPTPNIKNWELWLREFRFRE